MKLLELYKSLLKTANLVCSEDGFISSQFTDKPTPAMVKGKRLVLPTVEHLSHPKPDEQIIFHPLSENTLREESTVLEHFRNGVNNRLNFTMGVLCMNLLTIASSPDDHAKLSPDQLEFLSKLKHVDEKTLELFQKLLAKMPINQHANVFIKIFLKRGGSIDGKKYHRVGVTTFPFYAELKKNTDVYGIKLSNKNREMLINMMEYIFPQITEAEAYNRGTHSDIAPFIDALMKTVIAIASPINDQISLFSNLIDESDKLMIEDGWVETFDNLNVMIPEIRKVPMQAGNEGDRAKENIIQPVQQVQHQPIIQPTQPFPYNNNSTAYAGPSPAAIVKTQNGLDFASLKQNVPGFGNSPVNNQPAQYSRETSQPRWAPQVSQNPWQQQQQPQSQFSQGLRTNLV